MGGSSLTVAMVCVPYPLILLNDHALGCMVKCWKQNIFVSIPALMVSQLFTNMQNLQDHILNWFLSCFFLFFFFVFFFSNCNSDDFCCFISN